MKGERGPSRPCFFSVKLWLWNEKKWKKGGKEWFVVSKSAKEWNGVEKVEKEWNKVEKNRTE